MTDYEAEVRAYLAYCKQEAAELKLRGSHLDKRYHPTEAGLLKLVHCRTPADAQGLRQAYAAVTAIPAKTISDKEGPGQ